jgi:hypothetical protein
MTEKEAKDLDAIKRLMILLLYKIGSSSDEIGTALDVDSSVVRKMFATRKIKRIIREQGD